MSKIHRLSEEIIAGIAAGQVVERPASVIKELIENALDANADTIEIELENAGIDSILVSDNGEGINKADLQLAPQPHTTSKLTDLSELSNMVTLGFRGEALASIAEISELTITSRHRDEPLGNKIIILNGKKKSFSEAGRKRGTTVIVSDLFGKVPARRKFLRSQKYELTQILSVITAYAIAYPKVTFRAFHNKKPIFTALKTKDIKNRIQQVYGDGFTKSLIPITVKSKTISAKGFIGTPKLASHSTQTYLFVNNRLITDPATSKTIKRAYGTLIEAKYNPLFFIFLEMDTQLIDVNVDPQKSRVRFSNNKELQETLSTAISEALSTPQRKTQRQMNTGLTNELRTSFIPWNPVKTPVKEREILQVHNLFLIVESDYGVVIYDQHALHERILYEQLLSSFKSLKSSKELSKTKTSLSITLPQPLLPYKKDIIKVLTRLGLEIEGDARELYISRVPNILMERSLNQMILDVFHDLTEELETEQIDDISHRTLSYIACRSAIKGGETLDPEARKKLIDKLKDLKTPYSCPHGRPLSTEISFNELLRMFHR